MYSLSVCMCYSLSRVWLFAAPWTIAHQAPLSMEFSRQDYWSGLPFPSPGDLPDRGIEPGPPALKYMSVFLNFLILNFIQDNFRPSDLQLPSLPLNISISFFSCNKVIYPWVGAFQVALLVKTSPASAGDIRDSGLIPGPGRIPGEGNGKPPPVFWPGKFYEQRSLAGLGVAKSGTKLSTEQHKNLPKLTNQIIKA